MGPFTGLWFVCTVLCSLQCTNPGAITDTQTSAQCGECVCLCVHVCGRKRRINRLSIKPWPMPVSPRKRVKRESHGPWEGKGGGCGGGAGARSLSVSASRAWFDIWYWACGIWMQIYFDCPSVCLVYEESIGDLCACISERAGSETQRIIQMYYITRQFTCIRPFFPLRAIKKYFIRINILDYQSKVRKIYIHLTGLM